LVKKDGNVITQRFISMKHKPVKIWEFYRVENDKLVRERIFCKKCGDTFMAAHKEKNGIRYYCGKCKTTIIQNA